MFYLLTYRKIDADNKLYENIFYSFIIATVTMRTLTPTFRKKKDFLDS
jgi:hypothetical protein